MRLVKVYVGEGAVVLFPNAVVEVETSGLAIKNQKGELVAFFQPHSYGYVTIDRPDDNHGGE